jgi:hypothetical protein
MYNEASGQMVNREKSSICFSPGILEETRAAVKQKLDILYYRIPVDDGEATFS